MKLNDLNNLTAADNDDKMPALFLGHGNPMNAIEENEFVDTFRQLGKDLTKPNAIVCISAHWETKGTYVTAMPNPRTIHDFGGFPKELYEIQYPVKGNPELASEIKDLITKTNVGLDNSWGLDHGVWTLIKHLYPYADVPVIQISIDYTKPAQYHYDLAKELAVLRSKGVLMIGSGNLVHNLRLVNWYKLNDFFAFDWATEASEKMKTLIMENRHDELINYTAHGKAFELAIPTPEHYLPLLYILALKDTKEEITIFNDKAVGGSLTMTSVKIGK